MTIWPRHSTMAVVALASFGVLAPIEPTAHADGTQSTASDGPVCGEYRELRTMLADRFGEAPTSAGLAENGTILEVFASASAETWTLVKVEVSGRACVFAVGRHWEQHEQPSDGNPV